MPHVRQNMCFAVCVPNVYVVIESAPARSVKRGSSMIRWRMPFIVQIEQLQSRTSHSSSASVTRNRIAPQWQLPS